MWQRDHLAWAAGSSWRRVSVAGDALGVHDERDGRGWTAALRVIDNTLAAAGTTT